MVDISKCSNKNCKKKEICYRYVVASGLRQSYAYFKPDEETGKCKYFIKVDEGVKLN